MASSTLTLWLASTAVCMTCGVFFVTDRLEDPSSAVDRGTVALTFVTSVVLTALILQRLYNMPKSQNGRVVQTIQVSVLAMALLNAVALFLVARSEDGGENYALLVQKTKRVGDFASFFLITIPSAYVLSMLMRYLLRFQNSTMWNAVTLNTDDIGDKASEGLREAGQALSMTPVKAMAALGNVLAESGNAKELAGSVQALADAIKLLDEKVDLRTLERMYGAVTAILGSDDEE